MRNNPKTCDHDWKEQKTYFKQNKEEEIGENDPYVISHYCELCGQCETYHGGEKKWIAHGNIYDYPEA